MDVDRILALRSTVRSVVRDLDGMAFAWAASFLVEASVSWMGVQKTIRWIEGTTSPRDRAQELPSFRRDTSTVAHAYRLSPFSNTCLRRSIVQYWLGRRRGFAMSFVMGVRSKDSFAAHAWVETGGASSDGTTEEVYPVIFRSPE